jgi:hypothetical protein
MFLFSFCSESFFLPPTKKNIYDHQIGVALRQNERIKNYKEFMNKQFIHYFAHNSSN